MGRRINNLSIVHLFATGRTTGWTDRCTGPKHTIVALLAMHNLQHFSIIPFFICQLFSFNCYLGARKRRGFVGQVIDYGQGDRGRNYWLEMFQADLHGIFQKPKSLLPGPGVVVPTLDSPLHTVRDFVVSHVQLCCVLERTRYTWRRKKTLSKWIGYNFAYKQSLKLESAGIAVRDDIADLACKNQTHQLKQQEKVAATLRPDTHQQS